MRQKQAYSKGHRAIRRPGVPAAPYRWQDSSELSSDDARCNSSR
ncbi:hypothetical protein [Paenibacillus sp. Marseille-Q9583]